MSNEQTTDDLISRAKLQLGVFPWESYGGIPAGLFNPAAYIAFQNLADRFYNEIIPAIGLPSEEDEETYLRAFANLQTRVEGNYPTVREAMGAARDNLSDPIRFARENMRALYRLTAGELGPFVNLVAAAEVVPAYEITRTSGGDEYLTEAAEDWSRAWLTLRALVELWDSGVTLSLGLGPQGESLDETQAASPTMIAWIVVGTVAGIALITLVIGYLYDISSANARIDQACEQATNPKINAAQRAQAAKVCTTLNEANAGGLAGSLARSAERFGTAVAGGTAAVFVAIAALGGVLAYQAIKR